MQIEDSTVWSGVLALLGGVGAGVKMVFTRLNNTVTRQEFDTLEREVVRKDDFKDYAERSEKSRTELRDAVVKLFDKFDELKTIIIERKQ